MSLKKQIRSIMKWFVAYILLLLISIFIHEVGHGIANAVNGIDCSTGFNRVGDIYKNPLDDDFRAAYASVKGSLLDFGVPATLLLAITGTIVYRKKKEGIVRNIALGFAEVNSLMRLLPCLWVVLTPLFTGEIHVEDEYETGQILAEYLESQSVIFLPALVSILISVVCFYFIIREKRKNLNRIWIVVDAFVLLLAFDAAMVIANKLDVVCRINWHAW